MNSNCDTCKIIYSDSDDVIITKTNFWRVALHANQAYLGQSFITLLEHKDDLSKLSSEEWEDFEILLKNLEQAVRKTFGAEHFNWSSLMNEAYRVEKPVPHVHWNMFPRYSHEVVFHETTFEDLEFGNHYVNRQLRPSQATLAAIGSEIRRNLELDQ